MESIKKTLEGFVSKKIREARDELKVVSLVNKDRFDVCSCGAHK